VINWQQSADLAPGKLRDLAAAIACADLMVAADTGPARGCRPQCPNYYLIRPFLAWALRSTAPTHKPARIPRGVLNV